jgi:hypothetical protein
VRFYTRDLYKKCFLNMETPNGAAISIFYNIIPPKTTIIDKKEEIVITKIAHRQYITNQDDLDTGSFVTEPDDYGDEFHSLE